jgi:hypothetical protein
MTVPNFFIVGAPKCGTTALTEYLRGHPAVFLSRPKEPHYFATDLPGTRYVTTLDDYLRLFAACKPAHKAVGEASVWYLYSKEAIRRIHDFNPDARLIVMLRNPLDMIPSLHGHMLFAFNEDRADLDEAWRLQEQRNRGEALPAKCFEPKLLQYAEIGCLGTQVERLLSVFPREQVHFVLFDDWVADPGRSYRAVLDFLGLPDDKRTRFPPVNVQKRHRFPMLGSLLLRPPLPARAVWRKLRALTGPKISLPVETLIRLNSKANPTVPVHHDIIQLMNTRFKPDIVGLETILERKLTHWTDDIQPKV